MMMVGLSLPWVAIAPAVFGSPTTVPSIGDVMTVSARSDSVSFRALSAVLYANSASSSSASDFAPISCKRLIRSYSRRVFVTLNCASSLLFSRLLPSSIATVWPAFTVSFSFTRTFLIRAVIFEETSTESTGMIVPVAETVDFRLTRFTVAVCTCVWFFASCLPW